MSILDRSWLDRHPLPQPEADTDKNSRGRVLIAGGAASVPGALGLAGEAALRAGAGKVQLATVDRVTIPLGVLVPEAAVYPLPEGAQGELGEDAGASVRDMLERCDALVLGPGTGAGVPARAILGTLLEAAPVCAMLIDAGMLGGVPPLERAVRTLGGGVEGGRVVLTPHPGEMARLMDCDEEAAKADPKGMAEAAAARFAAVVVMKGPRSWVAAPGEESICYPGGGVGLATGGSGDVLAGLIGGLLARGAAPLVAAAWGVWLHGEAGRALATRVGAMGFLAREIGPEVPRLMGARGGLRVV